MHKKYKFNFPIAIILFTLVMMIASTVPPVFAANPSEAAAYSLIAAVNDLRAGNGIASLSENVLLNIAAQSHSEYQASLGYWTHQGPGGSNETDRAYAVGYGSGFSVACDEAVAVASSDKDAAYIVYTLWNDYVHRDLVLLNSKYLEIGAGVAKGSDGLYYYTVDVCVSSGSSPISPTKPQNQSTNAAPSPVPGKTVTPLATATPREDGSIWHVVQPGEYLFLIALSYKKSELELATMNGLSPANPIIYAGQELLIQKAPTPTVTPTTTNTPRPPTRTPRPTQTARPTRLTATPQNTPTQTPTPTELPPILKMINQVSQRTWGGIILAISLIGIALSFLGKPKRKRENLDAFVETTIQAEEDHLDLDSENGVEGEQEHNPDQSADNQP